jgi:hypothetical protein
MNSGLVAQAHSVTPHNAPGMGRRRRSENRDPALDYGVLLGCALPARARIRHGHVGVDADCRPQLR